MTHIFVDKLNIVGSDNGLSPGRHQAIIWTDVGIMLIGLLGTNFSEILSKIHTSLFKKMHLKMSSAKWRQFCLGLNVLTHIHHGWFTGTESILPFPHYTNEVIVTNTVDIDRYPTATKHKKQWKVCIFLWAQYIKGDHILIIFHLKSTEDFSRINCCDQLISGCRKSYQIVWGYGLTIPKISLYILTPSKVFIGIFPCLMQNAMNLFYWILGKRVCGDFKERHKEACHPLYVWVTARVLR